MTVSPINGTLDDLFAGMAKDRSQPQVDISGGQDISLQSRHLSNSNDTFHNFGQSSEPILSALVYFFVPIAVLLGVLGVAFILVFLLRQHKLDCIRRLFNPDYYNSAVYFDATSTDWEAQLLDDEMMPTLQGEKIRGGKVQLRFNSGAIT